MRNGRWRSTCTGCERSLQAFPSACGRVRTLPSLAVQGDIRLKGDFATLVWRDATGQTRVQVALNPGNTARSILLESTALPERPTTMDEVLRALTGSTSIEWLRGVFAESCSLRWSDLAKRIGARPDQLDDLSLYFRALTTTEEDALWRAAITIEDLMELDSWLELLVSEPTCLFQERLRDEMRLKGCAFWRGIEGEWLNAIAGETTACLTSSEMAARLATSSRKTRALLIRDDLAKLLVRLRVVAEREWADLAPWYRSRIEESCGTLSRGLRADRVVGEVNLWMKKVHQRVHGEAVKVAGQRARATLLAALAPSTPDDGDGSALVELAIESSPESDEIVGRIFGGDLRPCLAPALGSSRGSRQYGGLLGHLHGRRIAIEVLLPFLQRKSWMKTRENLATVKILQTGDRHLTVSGTEGSEASAAPLESAALLLSAAFASRSGGPADDMLHMVHENRRTLQSNEVDVPWLRLIGAYGLSLPDLPASSREATLRMEIPWNWAEAWCHTPLKRDAGYLDKFMRLSLTMQEMARHWLPALCLSTAGQFDTPNAVLPLLVYAASQPYADRRKAEFGYDAMSPFRVERAAASAVGRLPEILDPIYRSLKASERSQTAEFYCPDRAPVDCLGGTEKASPLRRASGGRHILPGALLSAHHALPRIARGGWPQSGAGAAQARPVFGRDRENRPARDQAALYTERGPRLWNCLFVGSDARAGCGLGQSRVQSFFDH